MTYYIKHIFHFLEEKSFLRVSAIPTILLLCCIGIPDVFAGNVITSGTKVKVLSGTCSASVNDMLIKSGATLTNEGMLILKKGLANENAASNPIGTGTVKLMGTTIQTVTGQNTIQNLIIDNASGITIGGNTNVNGTLTLTNGLVTLGDNMLLLGPSALISGTPSSSNMIVATAAGELRKNFLSGFTGSFTFPVGDNTGTPEYSPITLNFTAGTFGTGNYIGVNLRNYKYPDTLVTGNYLKRYWNISQSGITGLSCNSVSQYVPADVVGDENIIEGMRITPTPVITYDLANTTTHQLTANGIISFGSYTGSQQSVASLNGLSQVCANSTGNVYTTDAGKTNYVWVVSSGGTITAGGTATDNTITITWNTAGPQTVSVSYNGSSNPTILNVTVNPLPVPTITGLSSVCTGTTGVTYTTETGMTGYTWTISAGGTITAGSGTKTITVTWNTPGVQNVTVNYTNGNSCTAYTATVHNVTVNPLPVPTITGLSSVCAGTTGVTYTTETGMTGYTWTISAGGTITAGTETKTITVTWNTLGAQNVTVNYTNGNSCTASTATVHNVTVNPLPVPTITGLSSVCAGTTGVTYTTETGMTGYTWTISAGGTITSGTGTKTITVTWNTTGAQNVTVNYTNGNSCTASTATVHNVTVNPLPVPTITGLSSVCAGTTGVTYTTETGMTGYTWTISAGGTITAGTETNTITVTWNTTGAQNVTVNYTNGNSCTASTATVHNVTVNPLPVPTITGLSSVCAGTTGVTYTTETGMTGYTWTISAGGTITAGTETKTITVTWNTLGPQNVTVNYTNGNSCTASTATVHNVTVNPLPVPTITGPASLCIGIINVTYTTETGMSSYAWTISSGGTITAGDGTNTITVTWNTAGSNFINVNYQNSSGCVAPSATTKSVYVSAIPVPILDGSSSVCQNNITTYSTDPGQMFYQWVVSKGGILINGSGSTNSAVKVKWTGKGSQTVSVSYTNIYGCTAAAPTVKNVTINPLPSPVITGPVLVDLNTTNQYNTASGMIDYTWTVSSGGTITSGGGTGDSWANILWSVTGSQTVSVNYSNSYGCATAAPATLAVMVNPLKISQIFDSIPNNGIDTINNHNESLNKDRLPEFSVYPVPNDGRFIISLTSFHKENYTINIYNYMGTEVYNLKDLTVDGIHKQKVDISSVAEGVYMVIIRNVGNQAAKRILIIK